jgi:hypothetical protein
MSTPTQSPVAAVRHGHASMAPLRSYLFLLVPRARLQGETPLIHYVVEESPERAIQVCDQSYPGHRIVAVRDVTDHASAA